MVKTNYSLSLLQPLQQCPEKSYRVDFLLKMIVFHMNLSIVNLHNVYFIPAIQRNIDQKFHSVYFPPQKKWIGTFAG